jgi:hypothetical protein
MRFGLSRECVNEAGRVDQQQHAMQNQDRYQPARPAIHDERHVAEKGDQAKAYHALHAKRQQCANACYATKAIEVCAWEQRAVFHQQRRENIRQSQSPGTRPNRASSLLVLGGSSFRRSHYNRLVALLKRELAVEPDVTPASPAVELRKSPSAKHGAEPGAASEGNGTPHVSAVAPHLPDRDLPKDGRKHFKAPYGDLKEALDRVARNDPEGALGVVEAVLKLRAQAVQRYEGTVYVVTGNDGIAGSDKASSLDLLKLKQEIKYYRAPGGASCLCECRQWAATGQGRKRDESPRIRLGKSYLAAYRWWVGARPRAGPLRCAREWDVRLGCDRAYPRRRATFPAVAMFPSGASSVLDGVRQFIRDGNRLSAKRTLTPTGGCIASNVRQCLVASNVCAAAPEKGNANNIQRGPPSQDAPYHAVKPNAIAAGVVRTPKRRRRATSPNRSCAHWLIDRVGRDDETGCQVEQKN